MRPSRPKQAPRRQLPILGLVPARGGSKRAPDKNLAHLGGRSLVRRALETCVESGAFATVALSSEAPAILAEAEGLEVLAIERPGRLATDSARTLEAVLHALEEAEAAYQQQFEAVAVVQCTSPFTAPEDLVAAVELLERSGAESVVSVARVEPAHHPLKLKRLVGDRLVPYLEDDDMMPGQELPALWARNGSVYLSRRDVLERGEMLSKSDTRGFEMPPERSFDIDSSRDLAFAEFLLGRVQVD